MFERIENRLAGLEAGQAEIRRLLEIVIRQDQTIINQGVLEMATLDALTAQVANDTTVINSAITLINGIAAQIAAAGVDPVALNALVTQLKSNDDSLAAAVAANTPAAPAP